MQPTLVPNVTLLALLGDLRAGYLLAAELFPFVNDVDPGQPAVIGDFTPATFVSGATPRVITWDTISLNGIGRPILNGSLCAWDYVSGVTTEVVYGVVLTETGGDLVAYARLNAPKPMAAVTDALTIVPRLVWEQSGWGLMVDVDE